MCGICGELSFGDAPVEEDAIRAMARAIQHRGPDDEGFHVQGPIGLGHRRLSIIDLSSAGRQPIWSDDHQLCIIFNGEVYNYPELRRQLEAEGRRFRGASDSEVIVNAMRAWGVETATRRLIGMFAFALWSPTDGQVTLVRDRVGVKPLFYWRDSRRLLFGSEMRALMAHPGFTKQLDPTGLGQFFVTGFTLGETTALRNVRRVLPGHIVSFDRQGNCHDTCYWSVDDISRSREDRDLDDAADELEALLESAVGYRLVSDVPVANFLSGGIDSSLVAAILRKTLGADVLNITVGFREAAFDESPKAAQVARELGLRHEIHQVDATEAQQGLETFAEVFDEPFGDTSGIPTHILSRVARQHVKVALSADGGDEQFGGYDSYTRYASAWSRLGRIPASVRRAAMGVGRRLPARMLAGIAFGRQRSESLRPQNVARVTKALRIGGVGSTGDLIRTMFEKGWTWDQVPAMHGAVPTKLFDRTVLADPALAAADDELVGTMMRADYQAFLRDDILTKVDRASMHVSLEARDPMLDHRIAEFAFGLPISLVLGGGEEKRILKHLLRRWVSDDVVASPKRGFSIPLYTWMYGAWQPTVRDFLSTEAVERVGVLDPREVQREVDRFYGQSGGSAERIWMLLSFQMWAMRWLT
jgi:asparagine synthase (glutamine-hydrolysing)